jgi:hypothetical protein
LGDGAVDIFSGESAGLLSPDTQAFMSFKKCQQFSIYFLQQCSPRQVLQ